MRDFVRRCCKTRCWVFAFALMAQGAPPARAAEVCEAAVGRLVSVEGSVEVQRSEEESWRTGTLDEPLCQGDTIRVGERSRAEVALINDAVLRLDEETSMRLLDISAKEEERSLLDLIVGAFQSFSRAPRRLAVNTPYVNGLIEGTEFLMRVEANQAWITVFEGKVAASNDFGRLLLAGGESAVAKKGKAPQPQIVVRPRDAVQWALYYPPVVSVVGGRAARVPADVPPSLRETLEAARRGDTVAAFRALDRVPEAERGLQFHLYRAALLLNVGRADEARGDIDQALARDPKASLGYALRSVISVAQNKGAEALADGQRAVELAPDSAAAHIALSYAQQAHFQLEQARDTLLRAVETEPENPLAWARLAELHASFGEFDKALKAAEKAVALEPDLSRTQTVLGFAYLTQAKTAQAKQAFEKAMALDQADPLPRLGLGLAKIREGDLHEGRQEIEVATGLDSNNSLVRSYLGKAYYEEKRTELTDREYATAKELDPNDPTPFFYDAIQKQTTNRPVEALQDAQKAIELNNNRAVYRSRLLLDSDLAARSASLARVYTDLGFQQLALVEGWKSVNTDPSNYSAHRFLADSYSVRPRHEIARVSELLQSQLLQPLNTTPIQPRLAESNLFLIGAGGPGGLSFNEFNPLFSRDGFTVQASGLVGENSTYAGEGVVSGIYRNTSFSVGGFHYRTDGFRPNADQEDDIANAFVQFEVSPKTSIQAEYRYRNAEIGDLQLRFFPEEFFPGQRTPQERHTYRLGARHAFSPTSIALASFIYSDSDFGAFDRDPFVAPGFITFLGLDEPQEAFSGELQHIFRSRYVSLTTGVGHFDRDSTEDFTARFALPPPDDVVRFPTLDTDLRHTNVYAYSNINLIEHLTFTLGASGEFTEDDSPSAKDNDEFNPKVGIMWSPLRDTTVRFAAFRTSKRPVITNQTLEPTQVAGFNQFFDDFNGTTAWRYGAAIDQKFTRDVFGGVEISRRDQDVPASDQFGTPIRVDWQEDLARAYAFWTPHPWLAMRTEYQYERVDRDEELTDGVKESDTHRVPVGINFFHPSGVSAALKATYFNQDGVFESIRTGALRSGQDDFWTVDAAVSYRLPKRYGFITVGATNLFDEEFNYFDTDFNNPSIRPDRMVFGRVTLEFP